MQKQLSDRIKDIRPSGIRRIFDIACANPDGIDLSIGDPDFDVPQSIKDEAQHWLADGFNGYVSTRGIPELRDVLHKHLTERGLQFEDLLITAGATGAFYLTMLTLISQGDEVLITDPYFVAYANVIIMCGGIPKCIDTYPDFSLRADAILPLINERTKAIVINHPNNPTGVVYSREQLELIARIAEEHGLYVVSDEIYDRFTFNDEPFVSMGNMSARAIVISGFSKSAGMTGWRLGYVSASKKIIDAMATFQQYSYVCANSVAQKAAIKAVGHDVSKFVQRYIARRDRVYSALQESYEVVQPQGAFYMFPKAPGGDADAFVNRAIERKLFVIPGNVFSEKNSHFRLSLAVSDDKLDRAIDILLDIAQEF